MSRGKHMVASKAARRAWIVVVASAGMVLLFGAAAYAGYRYDRGRMDRALPGVKVAGIDVGGMTREEAARAVTGVASAIVDRQVEVRAGNRTWTESARSLGATVDLSSAVDRAFTASDSYGWPARLYHRLLHRPVHTSIDLTVSYDRGAVERFVRKVAADVGTSAQSASLDFRGGHLVIQHARPGTSLPQGRASKLLLAAVRRQLPSVGLPVQPLQPSVTEDRLGMTIIIRVSQNRLYLYRGTGLVKSYPVATGQLGIYDTPQGHFEIVNKRVNPTWYNPAQNSWGKDEPAIIPPGPDNPLGTRALDLSAPGIRIHGTPADSSIGHYASHGCIRMHIPDSEDLFGRVDVGAPVIIVW